MHRYHGNLEIDHRPISPVGRPALIRQRWRQILAMGSLMTFTWFWMAACASSVYSVVKMQVEREMSCVCGKKAQVKEVARRLESRPEVIDGDGRLRRTYQASCCGDRAYFECLPEVREQNTYTTVEDRGRMPTVDVIWHCWKVQNPSKQRRDKQEGRGDR